VESAPVPAVYDVCLELPGRISAARIVGSSDAVAVEHIGGRSRVCLPRIDIYRIVEVDG
jgi:hypothetical protein